VEALGHPLVREVRGAGLLLGIVLDQPVSAAAAAALRDAGFLVNPVQPDVIRLAPPLILTVAQADAFVAALPAALPAAAPHPSTDAAATADDAASDATTPTEAPA
ncbi:aminotransferase class III-fold pyridoxal phosphate-dependent enzyme, partial [Micromonospora chalcea]